MSALVPPCRDARPNFLTRAVTSYPVPCMLLVLALCISASVLPFLQPPSINASFETLTVRDQPVNDALSASNYLLSGSDSFWSSSSDSGTISASDSSSRRRLLSTFPPVPTAAPPHLLRILNSLTTPDDSRSREAGLAAPARQLRNAAASSIPFRNNINFALHVVFFKDDRSTMLTRETVAEIKRIENEIYALPAYERLCLHMSPGETGVQRQCRRPISMTNFVYGRFTDSGEFMADGSNDEAQDPVKAAQVRHACGACMSLIETDTS